MATPDGDDARWMRQALELAARGAGTVAPNPMVGCVLVASGGVVGEGWHERAGGPHAEVVALRAAGAAARGATAYVTLEPCHGTGRTGPCTAALLAAGVTRVVAAVADPNPKASGGAQALRAAGVDVTVGLQQDAARRQNEAFLHSVMTGLPFVIVKAAASLDGRSAAADGTSQWLTGGEARAHVHRLRAQVGAVLVGSGTVLADDPALTCRLPGYPGPQPLRVVLDRRGRTLGLPRRVYDGQAPTLLVTRARAAPPPRVEVAAATDGDSIEAALAALAARGVRSVLVEGGACVAGAFLQAGRCDKLVVHLAPLLLGQAARPLFAGDGVATLSAAPRFRVDDVTRAGDDVLVTLYPRKEA